MLPITSFNPASPTNGQKIALDSAEDGAKILFYNLSNNNIKLDFLNGDQDMLHAWEARWWALDGDTKEIDWLIDSSLATVGTQPISLVMGTLYGSHEELPGTYPINLTYQTNIGNAVSTVGGTASAVQNDGNIAGANVVEATPSGDGASAVSILNSGVAQLGSATRNGQLTVTNAALDTMIYGGDGIGTTGNNWEFMDTRTFMTKILGIKNTAGNGVGLGGNGTLDATVDTNGITLLTGTLTLLAGSLSRIKVAGPFNVATLGTTVAHGLGVIPDFVIAVSDSGSSHGAAYDINFGTMTTTQVTLYCNVNNQRTWLLSIKA